MKRTKFLIQSIFLIVLTCLTFLFSSCTEKIEGTYKFDSMTYNESGVSIEIKAGEKFLNTLTITEDFSILTLREDGQILFSISSINSTNISSFNIYPPDIYNGTWSKIENRKIALNIKGFLKQECECNGKTLKMEYDGMELILKKV